MLESEANVSLRGSRMWMWVVGKSNANESCGESDVTIAYPFPSCPTPRGLSSYFYVVCRNPYNICPSKHIVHCAM